MTGAQVRDWLAERYQVDAQERTVRRLVSRLREKHGITRKSEPVREYEAVELLPKGKQLQLDFGEKTVRDAYSSRYIKLYFAVFTLSHSRYKWGIFQDRPYNSSDIVQALYGCFEYFGGMPNQLVYDQDSILVVSENNGDIIHTQAFTTFLSETKLEMRVCRKQDPESKGLIEASVKFVKRNFMENRMYMGIDIWNRSFEEWLDRTGNEKEHNTTKRKPKEVFQEEQEHLKPIFGVAPTDGGDITERAVRQDNTVIYLSNRYSVPYGTYSKVKTVILSADGDKLYITNETGDNIAVHEISREKGKLIKLNAHRQDREGKVRGYLEKTVSLLGEEFRGFMNEICEMKPRYVKEQLGLIVTACETYGREQVLSAVEYCTQRGLNSANDLTDAVHSLYRSESDTALKLIRFPVTHIPDRYRVNVQKRELSAYAQAAVTNAGIEAAPYPVQNVSEGGAAV
jgi:transposase